MVTVAVPNKVYWKSQVLSEYEDIRLTGRAAGISLSKEANIDRVS